MQASSTPAPQRLSQWLIAQDPQGAGYQAGLSWRVPEEKPAQLALKLELLQSLSQPTALGLESARAEALASRLSAMPVTGRVPVAVQPLRKPAPNAPLAPPPDSARWA